MAEYYSKHSGAEIDAGIDAAKAALPRSGGAMTGPITIAATPTEAMQAANKGYVDKTAEDIRKEIPNGYTLPTASAEVKGGVMIGDGLQMIGDVLSLIPSKKFELIESIVINETGVSSVARRGSDGTLPDLSDIWLRVITPAGAAECKVEKYINSNKYSSPLSFRTDTHPAGSSMKRMAAVGAFNIKGMWVTFTQTTAGEISTASLYGYYPQRDTCLVEDGEVINKIALYETSGNGFPVGTTIEILGVRANA